MKYLYLVLTLLVCSTALPAQGHTDSLWQLWNDHEQPDTVRMKAVQDMAWSILYSNPDSAFALGTLELAFARRTNNKKWQGKALNTLGATDHLKGDYAVALQKYQHALSLFLEVGEKKSVSSLYNNIGLIFREKGNYTKALQYYEQYLKIGLDLRDTGIIANAYNNLGTVYSDQSNFIMALEYYQKGLDLVERLGNKSSMAMGYNNLGSIYFTQKEYPQALGYYQRSLVLREEVGDLRGMATVLNNIGLIYKDIGDHQQALEYYQKGLRIQEKLGDKPGLASTHYNIGSTLLEQKNYPTAIAECNKGLSISDQIGALRFARHACHCLYEAHKAMGRNAQALAFHERYLELTDSLQREETSKRLEQMEFAKQVMADSLTKEEEKLKMEMAFQQAVRKKNTVLNIALGAGVVVVVLAIEIGRAHV